MPPKANDPRVLALICQLLGRQWKLNGANTGEGEVAERGPEGPGGRAPFPCSNAAICFMLAASATALGQRGG